MRYAAEDIENQTFQVRVRGYDRAQVREFLRALARDRLDLGAELARVTELAEDRAREASELRRRERELSDNLTAARRLADDLVEEARERGAEVLEQARCEAAELIARADQRRGELCGEIERLERARRDAAQSLNAALHSALRLLEDQGLSPRACAPAEPELNPAREESGEGMNRIAATA